MWNSYPRPQLKRDSFQSLNGTWKVNGSDAYVPGCRREEELFYEKTFGFKRTNERVLLHFGAADQIAEVSLNEQVLGRHEGGYLPFEFDVSDYIADGENKLEVHVIDTLDHNYPYGKQKKNRGGMWYTPVSGIWQSVWLEQVPEDYIQNIKITPDLTGVCLEIFTVSGHYTRRIDVENPILWTPENPHLYYETVTHGEDSAQIYFALRTIDVREIGGIRRVCLNGKPVFLHGLLDQGYFGNSSFLPESPEVYDEEIRRIKSMGFNCLRKHIKIEPSEWYYACDRLGILVIQDIVNSGEYSFMRDTVLGTLGVPISDQTGQSGRRKEFWLESAEETQELLYNHPCVCVYTLFNEGWGQFESDLAYRRFQKQDPTRLYDSASGWFAQKESDFDSVHIYFRNKKLKPAARPMLLSECGGFSLNLSGQKGSYGYGACKNTEDLTDHMVRMYEKMVLPAIEKGLCGCIYTQVSDIEDEINGLFSSDRKTLKVNEDRIREISCRIYDMINKVF